MLSFKELKHLIMIKHLIHSRESRYAWLFKSITTHLNESELSLRIFISMPHITVFEGGGKEADKW